MPLWFDLCCVITSYSIHYTKLYEDVINLLNKVAQEKNATPAQIALAWILAQKPWTVPIPGTTKLHRLKENIGADSIELIATDLKDIENATSRITSYNVCYTKLLRSQ